MYLVVTHDHRSDAGYDLFHSRYKAIRHARKTAKKYYDSQEEQDVKGWELFISCGPEDHIYVERIKPKDKRIKRG